MPSHGPSFAPGTRVSASSFPHRNIRHPFSTIGESIMAYDDRFEREHARERSRGPEWRGDDSFGGGWGNQTSRPQRLGDRTRRPVDDPDYGMERYGGGMIGDAYGQEYGAGSEPSSFDLAPGYDPSVAGPRFDRVDV